MTAERAPGPFKADRPKYPSLPISFIDAEELPGDEMVREIYVTAYRHAMTAFNKHIRRSNRYRRTAELPRCPAALSMRVELERG